MSLYPIICDVLSPVRILSAKFLCCNGHFSSLYLMGDLWGNSLSCVNNVFLNNFCPEVLGYMDDSFLNQFGHGRCKWSSIDF